MRRSEGHASWLLPAFCVAWLAAGALWLGAAEESVAVTGMTQPIKDETLSALVSGKIVALRFREGDRVKAGDVVVDLEKRFDELEAKRRKLMWESKAELESAQARVETVKAELEGTRRVHEATQSVSRDELKQKELEYKIAVAETQRLAISEQIEQLEYEKAGELLDQRQIRSPLTGVLAKMHLEVGENCQPHQPLFRVVDVSRCQLVANVEASLARELEAGQAVRVELQAGEETISCQGTISFICPVVDAASGLQEVKAVFDNPGNRFYPGVPGQLLWKR